MEFAIITTGVVTDVIVADQSFIDAAYPGAVSIDGVEPKPGIGWAYDGTSFTPPTPPVPVPDPPQTVFTTQQFRARYTLDELILIDNYPEFPAITDADRQKMTTVTTSVLAADTLDITNPNVTEAVNFEAQVGFITAERAAEILDPASPPPVKAWKF